MAIIIDSYSEANSDNQTNLYSGANIKVGQSFTATAGTLNSCKWYLTKYGNPTGNAVACIYEHTGTYGTDGKPTGTALATSDSFDVSTLTAGTWKLVTLTFTGVNKITLSEGTYYVVSVEYSGGTAGNFLKVGRDTSSSTHSGNYSTYITEWVNTVSDNCFYVYKDDLITQTKTSTAKARVKSLAVTRTSTTKARIKQTDQAKSLTAKGRVVLNRANTLQSQAQVKQAATTSATSQARIKTVSDQTVQSKGQIKQPDVTKSLQAKTYIDLSSQTQSVEARAAIKATSSRTTQARGRIKQTVGGGGAGGDWYNANWSYRVKITVDKTKLGGADQSNFPVYVNLNNLPADFHTNVNQTDARDIRVTTSDGQTEVPREVVSYTAASDTGELWFKGTLSSSTDTDFYIYYGNADATEPAVDSTYGRNNVWSAYNSVFHLQESSGSATNSVGSNNGTFAGDLPDVARAGKIGKAQDFDGSGDKVTTTNYIQVGSQDFTISAWMYPDNGTNRTILSCYWQNGWEFRYGWSGGDTTALNFLAYDGSEHIVTGETNMPVANWYHVVAIRRSNRLYLYCNGNETDVGAFTYTLSTSASTGPFCIGSYEVAGTFFDGIIDEAKVLVGTGRAGAWVTAEYNNQNSPSTFYSVGTQETPPAGAGPTDLQAKAYIAHTQTKAIQGKADIKGTTAKSVQARTLVAKEGAKLIQGRAQIEQTATQTLQAKVQILQSGAKTLQSKARIKQTANTKTAQARGRVKQLDVTQEATARARISLSAETKTTTSKARVKQPSLTKTTQAKARVLTTYAKTLQSKAQVEQTAISKSITAKTRLKKGSTQTILARAFIDVPGLATRTVQTTARASISSSSLQTIAGRSRVKKTIGFEETTTAVFGLAVKGWKVFGSTDWAPTKLQVRAKIVYGRAYTIQALCNLKNFVSAFLQARANIVPHTEGAIISAARTIEGIVTTRQREGIIRADKYRR